MLPLSRGRPRILLENAPRIFSNLRTPGLMDEDWSLRKDFALPGGESRKITFSCNVFDAFNRFIAGGPSTTLEAANFGHLTGQANAQVGLEPRQIQFMLRFAF